MSLKSPYLKKNSLNLFKQNKKNEKLENNNIHRNTLILKNPFKEESSETSKRYLNYKLTKGDAKKSDKLQVKIPSKKKTAKEFSFEKIFDEKENQENVFDYFKEDLIENSINGVIILII